MILPFLLHQCTPDMRRLAAQHVDTVKLYRLGERLNLSQLPFQRMKEKVSRYGGFLKKKALFSPRDSISLREIYKMAVAFEAFREIFSLSDSLVVVPSYPFVSGYESWRGRVVVGFAEVGDLSTVMSGVDILYHEMGHLPINRDGRKNEREWLPFVLQECFSPDSGFDGDVVSSFLNPNFPHPLKDDQFLFTYLFAPFVEVPSLGERKPYESLWNMAGSLVPLSKGYVRRQVAALLESLAPREGYKRCGELSCYQLLLNEVSKIIYEEVKASALLQNEQWDTYKAIIRGMVKKREELLESIE